MKTLTQVIEMIIENQPVVIGVRGDDVKYGYMDYTRFSCHKLDEEDAIAEELNGTCAIKFWECNEDNDDIDYLVNRLRAIVEYCKMYGDNIHIIACNAANYNYGWDETNFGQEIIMTNAWVIANENVFAE